MFASACGALSLLSGFHSFSAYLKTFTSLKEIPNPPFLPSARKQDKYCLIEPNCAILSRPAESISCHYLSFSHLRESRFIKELFVPVFAIY